MNISMMWWLQYTNARKFSVNELRAIIRDIEKLIWEKDEAAGRHLKDDTRHNSR